jgi:hypothetical protein
MKKLMPLIILLALVAFPHQGKADLAGFRLTGLEAGKAFTPADLPGPGCGIRGILMSILFSGGPVSPQSRSLQKEDPLYCVCDCSWNNGVFCNPGCCGPDYQTP